MDKNENKNAEAFKITGDWDKQSKTLKSAYAQLTDADLKFETGKENELIDKMKIRLGKKRDEVIGIIKKHQPAKV